MFVWLLNSFLAMVQALIRILRRWVLHELGGWWYGLAFQEFYGGHLFCHLSNLGKAYMPEEADVLREGTVYEVSGISEGQSEESR